MAVAVSPVRDQRLFALINSTQFLQSIRIAKISYATTSQRVAAPCLSKTSHHLELRLRGSLDIFVKFLTGKTIALEVEFSDKIDPSQRRSATQETI